MTFCISIRETFWKSIACTVINKYSKGAAVQISTMFGLVYHVAFGKDALKKDFLGIDLTSFFGVRNIGHKSAMSVIFFLKTCKI